MKCSNGQGENPGCAELIRLKVDVPVVGGTTDARAVKAQTAKVPIVFGLAGDSVETGLVASLAHPGGNVTGISVDHPDLSAKDLELLRQLPARRNLPRAVACVFGPRAKTAVPFCLYSRDGADGVRHEGLRRQSLRETCRCEVFEGSGGGHTGALPRRLVTGLG
jgi:hypothetical protein